MKKFFLFFALVIIGPTASAANVWLPAGGVAIEKVQGTDNGTFAIYGPQGTDSACESGRIFFIGSGQNNVSDAGVKMLASIALTAYTTGKNVRLYYDNATSSCWVNQVLIE